MTDLMPSPATSKGKGNAKADLDAKYSDREGSFFFTGVQGLVRVPIDQMLADKAAGHKTATFISGYQGSPLGGYDREFISRKKFFDGLNIIHKPGLNEELGATAVMGSQVVGTFPGQRYDGVLGIWYGKGPGLDRAGDAIRHAQYAGTSRLGGVLALTGDDPANKSSTLPSASEATLADLHLPILHPGNVQEVLDLGMHGVALSRAVGLWTAIKIVTAVADASGTAEVGPGRIKAIIPELMWRGKVFKPTLTSRLAGPVSNEMESEIYEARLELARLYSAANHLNRVTVDAPDAWLGIAASGRCYHETKEALHMLGLDDHALRRHGIRLFQIAMMHPFDRDAARQFGRGLREIMVVEEKRPFLETALRDALYGVTDAPSIIGKRDTDGVMLVPGHGSLDADVLVEPLRRRLTQRVDPSVLTPAYAPVSIGIKRRIQILPSRTAYFCSGCPHSTGTKAPEGALVGTGIGCHGLAGLMAADRVGTLTGNTQMGGEGTQWVGIEPFVEADHLFQNMGDGTFAHSGSLSVRQAITSGSNVTFKILYNGTVAMTGGQDAPGAMPIPQLSGWLLAEGAKRVLITTDDREKYKGVSMPAGVDVWDRDRIIEAQEKLAKVKGVTVLIHDQACAAEKRRDRKRGNVADPPQRIVINERVCEGCGDCGTKSNCLSVQPVDTEFGRKTQIHQSSCNKDYSCLAGDCPSFLTVVPRKKVTGKANRAEGGARRKPEIDVKGLPEPTPIVPTDNATIRMPGIGGTGVVTVSQIIGTAATIAGKYVGGLDQTGLSQKAGPVVSDLHISSTPLEGTNKLTAGSVDLYLVFDLLVGLASNQLVGVSPTRSVAVVSTTKTATGQMVRDVRASYPDLELLKADLNDATRGPLNQYFDATAITEGLFGESTTANVFQLGVAYQIGALPIPASAIEQAIELNGAAVAANTLAFRWGRQWAVDPAKVRAASVIPDDLFPMPTAAVEASIVRRGLGDGELGRLVRVRAGDLVAYQDEKYADRYLDSVALAFATGNVAFAEAVARNLYKLMAYKDEYEVARLHLEEAARIKVDNAVGIDVKISWNIQPPLMKSLGLDRKIQVGPWFAPAFKALRSMKKLRGTKLDPFGYDKVRRTERSLVKEYVGVIEKVAGQLGSASGAGASAGALAVQLANLPDGVRGYEDVKMRNVETYRSELARLRSELGA